MVKHQRVSKYYENDCRILFQRHEFVSRVGRMWFAFRYWYSESSVEKQGERDRRPNVVVVVWITQLLACRCWWLGGEVLFRASQKLMFFVPGIFGAHLCVLSVIRGLGDAGESKMSSCCFWCGSRKRTFHHVQECGCKDKEWKGFP